MPIRHLVGVPRVVLLAGLVAGVILTAASTAAAAPRAALHVRGNRLLFGPGAGRPVQLRGVNRSGTEYACIQGWGLFQGPAPNQIDSSAMIGAMLGWDINVVRVPLNEDCWLGLHTVLGLGGVAYRAAIEAYVHELNAAGLFAILDLHWVAPGAGKATSQLPMADADHAPAFWRSVAATFRGDGDVLFDLYNEPYGISWRCWEHGCQVPAGSSWPAYRAAGMQELVGAVRSTGARQPLMLGGLGWAADLSGWLAHEPVDPLHELLASEHDYGGLSPCGSPCQRAVAATAAKVPVEFGELGETDCRQGYIDSMMRFADAHGIGYLGWAWDATDSGWSCTGGPSLITGWNGHPTPYGQGFRAHFRALGPPIRP
jgi:endoglucanase